MNEIFQKRNTDVADYQDKYSQHRNKPNLNRSLDQQLFFSKMQQNYDAEERNQKIQQKNNQQKNERGQNKINPKIQIPDFDQNAGLLTKIRTSSNIDQPNDFSPFNPQRKQMMVSKSAVINHKKQESLGQTPYDQLSRFNVSPPRKSQNHSLPPIQLNKKPIGQSPAKSTYTTPKHSIQNDQFHNLSQPPELNQKPERRIRQSEYQLNQIYSNQRDPRYIHYDVANSYHPLFLYNQKQYQITRKEDEEFRQKLIKQNEKLMQMFEQMQRNHQEEINILKLREKHTLKMIQQQQEQINLQNRKIECRDMPPPNFFLAPLQL